MNNLYFVLAVVIAYLLGNISPSTILAKLAGKDIKKEGSGNAGTTNALRVLGKKAAVITLVIDIGKGVVAVLIGGALAGPVAAYACAPAVFIGHVWPVLLKFKGGKGVATAFGTLLAINWVLALICLAIVVAVVIVTRMVSLGSVTAAVCFVVLAWFMEPDFLIYGLIMAAILIFKHRSNIARIIRGEENRLSFKK